MAGNKIKICKYKAYFSSVPSWLLLLCDFRSSEVVFTAELLTVITNLFISFRFFWPSNSHLYYWQIKASLTPGSISDLNVTLLTSLFILNYFLVWCSELEWLVKFRVACTLISSWANKQFDKHYFRGMHCYHVTLCTVHPHSDSRGRKRNWCIFSHTKNWRWVTE